jgi:hypothetical protein
VARTRTRRPAQDETRSEPPASEPGQDALALVAFLAGPVAWSLDLALSYGLVRWVRHLDTRAPVYAVTALALAVLAVGAWAALRLLAHPRGHERRVADRARFMARSGLAMQLFFLAVLAADLVPKLLLGARE